MIGVCGGTFDPIHEGHLGTAREAGKLTGCDRVLLIPAAIPPGKAPPVASAQQRLQMVKLATGGSRYLQDEGCELERAGPSYTVETLRFLRQRENQSLLLILGNDAFLNLQSWYCWQEIFELAHLLVAQRPGVPLLPTGELAFELANRRIDDPQQLKHQPSGQVLTVELTQYPVSSTRIRADISLGRNPDGLPAEVADYINQHQLYSD